MVLSLIMKPLTLDRQIQQALKRSSVVALIGSRMEAVPFEEVVRGNAKSLLYR
jgi:hypothetical protein